MKRAGIIVLLMVMFSITGHSQDYLKAVKLGSVRSDFEFTPEWQYISSDLYLYNADKFADILNQVLSGKKHRWFMKKDKDLRNILITLNLQGLGSYDKITYPLFNFVIAKDDDGNYKINTETNEVIRIIDNYPAPAVEDFITAKVDVKVVSKDDQVKVYKLAASQLETISAVITNPSTAVIKLVGEFGKMIQAAADEKEYHFTSTIRIYENDNFNQRLHSIVVFAFVPSQEKEYKIDLDLSDLQKVLQDSAVKVNRKFLYEYIKIKHYPYIVIVNYKSKYIPDVPEEIDFDVLKAREAKLKLDLSKGVINKEIYALEMELLDYLKIYAQFQIDLNNYLLNLQNRTTEDFSKFYYFLVRDYWNLRNYYKVEVEARAKDKIFNDEFKPLYDKFLMRVNMHLEQNVNLQNIRSLVETLYYLENTPEDKIPMDSASVEGYLAKLYGVPLPESEATSPEMQLINKWIEKLERDQYNKIYAKKIAALSVLPINAESYSRIIKFQRQYSMTQCHRCSDSVNVLVKRFQIRYDQYLLNKAKKDFEQVRIDAKRDMIGIVKRLSCIRKKLADYPGVKPEYFQLIEQDVVRLEDQRQALMAKLKKDYVFTSIEEIKEVSSDIRSSLQEIHEDLDNICKQEPQVCDCEHPWPVQNVQDTLKQQVPQDSVSQPQAQAEKAEKKAEAEKQ